MDTKGGNTLPRKKISNDKVARESEPSYSAGLAKSRDEKRTVGRHSLPRTSILCLQQAKTSYA
jgi:hypothetical protein